MNIHPSMQRFSTTTESSLQTFQSLTDIVLDATEQLIALNVGAARSLCAFASAQSLPVSGEALPNQLADRIAAQHQGLEQAAEYLRNVNEICLRTQSEVAEIGTRHINEMSSSMQTLFGEVAKLTPAAGLEMIATPANTRTTRKAA